ncbi:uncharacterized protein PGTG_16510 [Puccinia graminis f. sp. tritici CRL 75-36-700-3]|uniref:Uncharacterized protein n=1 Tax=Puccinia graminis f. sp. tritici (strain CRL 75-36-700-3 / race SCCL) TaxID=418459 RepID=E3L107_PUCGT|nr:uncharacterized protein PGTG_16510 [Puccinia graminis f. sp. tritici CRL 75-36-700-3]EFP90232.1 hypothetical protein PGTG_16510 [Puccinia graminis f. sp. tritici CRL 75-36-700-3]
MSKQKMNTSSSVHQHQLSRKNNDSHSRKLHINYQDFVPITKKTSNPPNPPPKRKRSLSALKLDLLATTSHNTLNQPLKKSKPGFSFLSSASTASTTSHDTAEAYSRRIICHHPPIGIQSFST